MNPDFQTKFQSILPQLLSKYLISWCYSYFTIVLAKLILFKLLFKSIYLKYGRLTQMFFVEIQFFFPCVSDKSAYKFILFIMAIALKSQNVGPRQSAQVSVDRMINSDSKQLYARGSENYWGYSDLSFVVSSHIYNEIHDICSLYFPVLGLLTCTHICVSV